MEINQKSSAEKRGKGRLPSKGEGTHFPTRHAEEEEGEGREKRGKRDVGRKWAGCCRSIGRGTKEGRGNIGRCKRGITAANETAQKPGSRSAGQTQQQQRRQR